MVTGKIFHCFVHPGPQEIGEDEAWQGAIPGAPVPETPISLQKVAEGGTCQRSVWNEEGKWASKS